MLSLTPKAETTAPVPRVRNSQAPHLMLSTAAIVLLSV